MDFDKLSYIDSELNKKNKKEEIHGLLESMCGKFFRFTKTEPIEFNIFVSDSMGFLNDNPSVTLCVLFSSKKRIGAKFLLTPFNVRNSSYDIAHIVFSSFMISCFENLLMDV